MLPSTLRFTLTCLLALATFSTVAQGQWRPLGIPQGLSSGIVVASDTVAYTFVGNHFFRQGADRVWKEHPGLDFTYADAFHAWHDTLVITRRSFNNHSVDYSTDEGISWETFRMDASVEVIPHTTYAYYVRSDSVSNRLHLVDFLTGIRDSLDLPNKPLDAHASTGHLLVRGFIDGNDQVDLIHLIVNDVHMSANTSEIVMDIERVFSSALRSIVTGEVGYLRNSDLVLFDGNRVDSLVIPAGLTQHSLVFAHGNEGWHAFYGNDYSGTDWWKINADNEWFLFQDSLAETGLMGFQGSDLLLSVAIRGYRADESSGRREVNDEGLSRQSFVTTDGNIIAAYDLYPYAGSNALSIFEDSATPLAWIVPDLPSFITKVKIIHGRVWVFMDYQHDSVIVFSIDPTTRDVRDESRGVLGQITNVAEHGDRIAITVSGLVHGSYSNVYIGEHLGSDWELVNLPSQISVRGDNGFTSDGEKLFWVRSTGYDIDLEYLQLLSVSVQTPVQVDTQGLGDQYYWSSAGRRELWRAGEATVFSAWGHQNVVVPDQPTNWIWPQIRYGLTTPANERFWMLSYSLDTALSTSNGGRTWNTELFPAIENYTVTDLFCLQHNCYANTEVGLIAIPRTQTGVDEPKPPTSPSTSNSSPLSVRGRTIRVTTPGRLQLFDIMGTLIHTENVNAGEHALPLLSAGTYVCTLVTDQAVYSVIFQSTD